MKQAAKRRRTAKKRARKKGVDMEKLHAIVQARAQGFLRDPNITSIGIGYKHENDQPTNKLAIQFTVRKKIDEDQPEAIAKLGTTIIPKSIEVDGQEIPTDVIEREYKPAYQLVAEMQKDVRKQRLATLQPGISVSHPSGTAGTLGLIVFDTHTGAACMLSNWHVLNTPEGKLGDTVVQPGPYDDNRVNQNKAGTLVRSHLGVAGDCAIARIEGRGVDPDILDLNTQPTRLARPALGDAVVKSGRTTAVTFGLVRRIATTAKINYGGTVGEQCVGGFEIGPDSDRPAANHQISMGGDSGSCWLIANKGRPTDVMVGLHFGGEATGDPDDHALACAAHSVFEKLEISLAQPKPEEAVAEAAPIGYDDRFLEDKIPLPRLIGAIRADAFALDGSRTLAYTHFSVALSKQHRMPRFVAWNIDGSLLKKLSRSGLRFRFDERAPEEFQIGDDVYSDNKLDRGHIARRADLVWGPLAEAKQANKDSFFFTNITPQHQAFNQSERHGLWGMLENAIYEDVDIKNLRISVMAGPLFKQNDPPYRGIHIPRDFWKVLVYVDDADDKLKVKAYLLSQDDLLNDLEALELDDFRLWHVDIPTLEQRSGLDFAPLRALDDFATGRVPEAVGEDGRRRGVREVLSREDLWR